MSGILKKNQTTYKEKESEKDIKRWTAVKNENTSEKNNKMREWVKEKKYENVKTVK